MRPIASPLPALEKIDIGKYVRRPTRPGKRVAVAPKARTSWVRGHPARTLAEGAALAGKREQSPPLVMAAFGAAETCGRGRPRTQEVRAYSAAMRARPPIQGRSAPGTVTLPSAFW